MVKEYKIENNVVYRVTNNEQKEHVTSAQLKQQINVTIAEVVRLKEELACIEAEEAKIVVEPTPEVEKEN